MRLPCPYCGERDAGEFVYRGDASAIRPADDAAVHDYVYLRANPAGPIRDHWYHIQGCRTWIVIARDTGSHQIEGAWLASEVGG